MKGPCQAHLGTLPERHQCPNEGEEFQSGGNGTVLLITYACAEHEGVLNSAVRQWKVKDNIIHTQSPELCHDEAPSP